MKQALGRLARLSASHPWVVLALALALSVAALFAAARLPVYTSRQALLPQNTEVAQRLNTFLRKFGSASDLVVALEGAPRAELEAFATELASRLRTQPEIAHATERLDSAFFLSKAYLLTPTAQLEKLETLLEAGKAAKPVPLSDLLDQATRLAEAAPSLEGVDLQQADTALKALDSVLGEWQRWLDAETTPGELQWGPTLAAVGAQELASGYFASRDGRMVFLFVHPRDSSEDFEVLQPFNDRVRNVADALSREFQARGRPAPSVVLTGMPAIEYEEYLDIDKDIRLVILTAAGLIAGLILLVVRSLPWALAIFVPMGLGALWSLALALGTVGHLTIITSSFLAILFGLGADYGIFTSSQIAVARRSGKPLIEAIGDGIAGSFTAVMTAGGASLLIFGALATVEFPGFAELGLVAAGGVLMILISTWLVQPAIYSLFPPKLRDLPQKTAQPKSARPQGFLPRSVALGLVVLAVITAAAGIAAGTRIPFDYDVLSLLPADSRAAQYQRRMAAETDYQTEVIIFTANSLDEIRRITDEAGHQGTIAKVQSITQLFPEDAAERLTRARRLAELAAAPAMDKQLALLDRDGLTRGDFARLKTLVEKLQARIEDGQEQAFSAGHENLVARLEAVRARLEAINERLRADAENARNRTEHFLRALIGQAHAGLSMVRDWRDDTPLTPADLPDSIRDRFVAPDGTLAAYAFPAESIYNFDYLDRLMTEVYAVSPQATGFPSTHLVFSRMMVESFTRGTLLAVGVCLIWLMGVLRSVRGFVLASLPLLIGGGWMLGLMALGGLRYNFANVIAVPLVVALAVDYGVWFSHRWRELKDASPLEVTRDAGKVIALAAGTELAGLGGITLASYRGVSSLGIDITLGLLACLVATLVVAPAIGQLIDSSRTP